MRLRQVPSASRSTGGGAPTSSPNASASKAGDKVDNAVTLNACIMADCLRTSEPILSAAVAKGTDVDQPRNLAKSVTVE